MCDLVGEGIFDITQQEKIGSLLMRNIGALSQSDRFINALTERMSECQALITRMTVRVELHINNIEE